MMIQQLFLVATIILLLLQCSSSSLTNAMPSHEKEETTSELSRFWKQRDLANNNLIIPEKKENQNIINVDNFGANADGSNDANAFMEAWKKACNTPESVLLVPANKTYVLNPTRFLGPCQPGFVMRVNGIIKASPNMKEYEADPRAWIAFIQAKDFTLDGGGAFDGNGQIWWETRCKVNKRPGCRSDMPPKAIFINESSNIRVMDLKLMNAQEKHLHFERCKGVDVSNLSIIAPEDSPNTDGIHIYLTENMNIDNCIISTGDDCLSIIAGSMNVRASNIRCGPGHGISIGSLGKFFATDLVSNIYINNASLLGTDNGLRIKTWQGGKGYGKNIKFEGIYMKNVSNPIIIDQNYCDRDEPCPQQNDAVQINGIVYKDIRGTSATNEVIKFDCSKTVPCEAIKLENVNLSSTQGGVLKTFCVNAKFQVVGKVSPALQCH